MDLAVKLPETLRRLPIHTKKSKLFLPTYRTIFIILLGHYSLGSLVKSGKMQMEHLLVKLCRSLTSLPSSFSHSTCQSCDLSISGDYSCFIDSFSLGKYITDFLNAVSSLTGAIFSVIY